MNVEYINHMGNDASVSDIARGSFANDVFDNRDANEGDIRLLKMLGTGYTSNERRELVEAIKLVDSDSDALALIQSIRGKASHWTPFAHCFIQTHCTAPLPIRTQAFKSKVGFVENEESRRYIISTPSYYVPDFFRKKPEGSIKQGSAGKHENSTLFMQLYKKTCNNAIARYEEMIVNGVCPEQARFILPQGVEVTWVWTGSLAAYARFYNLRSDPHAQKEIQDFAAMHCEIAEKLFPNAWKALTEFMV